MSLRRKSLVIVGVTLASLIIALQVVSQAILLKSYTNLETETTEQNLQRGLNALNYVISVMHSTNRDWAHWNDSYDFVQDKNQDYIDNNIYDGAFPTYGLNFMLYFNPSGQLVFGKGYDLNAKVEIPVPDSLRNYVVTSELLLKHTNETGELNKEGTSGLILLPEGPMLVASTPILPTNLEGESHGSLIWARFLDDSLLKDLSKKTSLSIQVQEHDSTTLPEDFKSVLTPVQSQASVVAPLDENTVAAYAALKDIYGSAVLVFRVDMPRSIVQQGQSTMAYFLLSLVLIGVVFLGVTLLLLERTVLSRLAYLNKRVSSIRTSTDLSMRIPVSGEDELANLAYAINGMLESLEVQDHLRRARDEAIEASRVKSQILANVSHDARTPLSVILLRADALQHGLYGSLAGDQVRVVESIISNGKQLLGFINNLLEMVQLDSGTVKVASVGFAPSALLAEITTSLQPLAIAKGLHFVSEVDPALPQLLCSDQQKLTQILLNLVNNAIKFTEHGTINVRIHPHDSTHWAMRVIDTGWGIAPKDQQRIFEAFWQVDGSQTRNVTTGVGLGLSIVKQLTDCMQGEIKLHSELGQGSTFTVIFPYEAKR
jgi:signal transduction histidine kinase